MEKLERTEGSENTETLEKMERSEKKERFEKTENSERSREEESRALEQEYVHQVYTKIAPHFSDTRYRAWPKVKQFIEELEEGSLLADVGCGNGKYLSINSSVYKVGMDRCESLADIAHKRGHEVLVCDNLHLPYRDNTFDAVLSIAVIHHFATTERRIQAVQELARICQPGGKIMISVWAMEQTKRKFEAQDVLVPWHLHPKFIKHKKAPLHSIERDFPSSSSVSEDDMHTEPILKAKVLDSPGLKQRKYFDSEIDEKLRITCDSHLRASCKQIQEWCLKNKLCDPENVMRESSQEPENKNTENDEGPETLTLNCLKGVLKNRDLKIYPSDKLNGFILPLKKDITETITDMSPLDQIHVKPADGSNDTGNFCKLDADLTQNKNEIALDTNKEITTKDCADKVPDAKVVRSPGEQVGSLDLKDLPPPTEQSQTVEDLTPSPEDQQCRINFPSIIKTKLKNLLMFKSNSVDTPATCKLSEKDLRYKDLIQQIATRGHNMFNSPDKRPVLDHSVSFPEVELVTFDVREFPQSSTPRLKSKQMSLDSHETITQVQDGGNVPNQSETTNNVTDVTKETQSNESTDNSETRDKSMQDTFECSKSVRNSQVFNKAVREASIQDGGENNAIENNVKESNTECISLDVVHTGVKSLEEKTELGASFRDLCSETADLMDSWAECETGKSDDAQKLESPCNQNDDDVDEEEDNVFINDDLNLHDEDDESSSSSSSDSSDESYETIINTLDVLPRLRDLSLENVSCDNALNDTSASEENPTPKLSVSSNGSSSDTLTPQYRSTDMLTSSEESSSGTLKFSSSGSQDLFFQEDGHNTTINTAHSLSNNSSAEPKQAIHVSNPENTLLQKEVENGKSQPTFQRYYHVFRENELVNLIEENIDSLHIISSYYDHANWCVIAEKVNVWKI